MSDFKAGMHKIRFRLGLRRFSTVRLETGGAYSVPPDSLSVFKGAYF